MKKEHLLLIGSSALALLIGLGVIRWLAPQLLGLPPDLQLVQVDKTVPPFFEGVFRRADVSEPDFIINDPLTRVRARPFFPDLGVMGPNDILGFRNRSVPTAAEVVTIGDSQTYGNNAMLESNWPSQMQRALQDRLNRTYSMAVGGWGAIQYLDMFTNATLFGPKVVVVAFYSGNDPLESFQMAYGSEYWQALIPNPELSASDIPRVEFPVPESAWWKVVFDDGVTTAFTPTLRLGANQQHPAVTAGYDIMAKVAERIGKMAEEVAVEVVFTVIPTKELAYAQKVEQSGLEAPAAYRQLVRQERTNIDRLTARIAALQGVRFVDVVTPLQRAAVGSAALYPTDNNGHPTAAGYRVIGRAVAESIQDLLPPRPAGLYAVQITERSYSYGLVNPEGAWYFNSVKMIEANGWPPGDIPMLSARDFLAVPYRGVIDTVDPVRFGPRPTPDSVVGETQADDRSDPLSHGSTRARASL
jgi:lysophospholipase L1-like esterase